MIVFVWCVLFGVKVVVWRVAVWQRLKSTKEADRWKPDTEVPT